MATYYEKSPPKFGVGDTVYINIFSSVNAWMEGEVIEEGDETVLIQWQHLTEPREYNRSEMGHIQHKKP